ncbi:MAG TPA: sugar phosphate isomerase/epimerase [Candidatus Avipropionibacterium avicola]|uniref:Sugar phosphate isomerase/epimerase n=1 Tax=Candidatus Avipropionibacterium avicola TaxID=2840701 RepID=A0A9D1KPV2_9ACTN|nr:sugar phosphate isomerase/epimerase [Candidatus Avipropionibacterium avicola]
MMMLKTQVAEQGMYAVLQQIKDLDLHTVEVSQIPMSEDNTADLERGVKELGVSVGALSVALEAAKAPATIDALDRDFDKIVTDCRRLDCRYLRIGMMPREAMTAKHLTEEWAAACEPWAAKLKEQGITLCYHNHHVDLAQFDGERIFDIVRRVAPSMEFEVDLHWVQRGGMAPLDMLEAYTGVCRLIHLKDYRVVPVPKEALDAQASGDQAAWAKAFAEIVQFAEVGQGNMNWPKLLPAAEAAGAEFFFIEQDDTYGRDPFDCLRDSREYLASIGW